MLNYVTIKVKNYRTVADNLVITATDDSDYIVKKAAVQYFDNTGSTIASATGISKGDVIGLYDFLNKDGDFITASSGADSIYDYIVIVD